GLLHRFSRATNPLALLFGIGGTKIFVLLQASMRPTMRAKLMAPLMTFTDEIRIGLRETTREEHGRFHMVTVAARQQRLEARLRSRHPITIDREIELFD